MISSPASAADATALDRLSHKHGTALLPVELDVTDRRSVFDAISAAHRHFGRLDIIEKYWESDSTDLT